MTVQKTISARKLHKKPARLENCDKEPIHLIGKIQSHGYLLGIDPSNFSIHFVSENLGELFYENPEKMLGYHLSDLFTKKTLASISRRINNKLASSEDPVSFMLDKEHYQMFVNSAGKYFILEIERAPHVKNEEFSPSEALNSLNASLAKITQYNKLQPVFDCAVSEVKNLTGFDRVMLYRFDDEYNGEVVAEAKETHLISYKGLHYPASDIPVQARRLYTINKNRGIANINDEGAVILTNIQPSEDDNDLDLSYSRLRSVSPIHLEYLNNMSVKASFSISIMSEEKLWGMIIMHHYAEPRTLNPYRRSVANLMSKIIETEIYYKSKYQEADFERFAGAQIMNLTKSIETGTPIKAISDHANDFLQLLRADGIYAFYDGNKFQKGLVPKEQDFQKMISKIKSENKSVFSTAALDEPIIQGKERICGLAALRLFDDLDEYLILFRKEKIKSINWAGKPEKEDPADKSSRISPRKSFEKYTQKIEGKSEKWTYAELSFLDTVREELIEKLLYFTRHQNLNTSGIEGDFDLMKKRYIERSLELKYANAALKQEVHKHKATQKKLELAKEVAEEMNRIKSNFLANISHEVRTPLNGIMGIANIIKASSDDESIKEYVNVQLNSSERLLNTIDGLLELSKMESRSIEHQIEKVDLSEFFLQTQASLKIIAEEKNLEFRSNLETHGYRIFSDKSMLDIIVINLLGNAIKYTEKGFVSLSSKIKEKDRHYYLLISVCDSGVGISEEAQNHVFKPFFQESKGLKRKFEGTGIGLSLVKRCVDYLNGKIFLNSAKGEGSEFIVEIPVKLA